MCYGLLEAYRRELSVAAIRTWQADKVMRELVRTDPNVGYSRTLTIERSNKPPITFQDNRFNAKWARQSWQALGSFLHVPTINQIETKTESGGVEKDYTQSMRTRCHEILNKVTEVLSSTAWNFIAGNFRKFSCDCGFEMLRRDETVIAEGQIDCVDCGRIYDVEFKGGDTFKVNLQTIPWKCPHCNSDNEVATYVLKEGLLLRCSNCNEEYNLKSAWRLEPANGTADVPTDEQPST